MNFLNRKPPRDPREIGRLRTDYLPPEALHAAKAVESLSNIPDGPLTWPFPDPADDPDLPLKKISHLDEIKVHLRQLTWAEMQEYCAGTNSEPKTVHEWSSK